MLKVAHLRNLNALQCSQYQSQLLFDETVPYNIKNSSLKCLLYLIMSFTLLRSCQQQLKSSGHFILKRFSSENVIFFQSRLLLIHFSVISLRSYFFYVYPLTLAFYSFWHILRNYIYLMIVGPKYFLQNDRKFQHQFFRVARQISFQSLRQL